MSILFVVASVIFSYCLLYRMPVCFSSWREGVISENYEANETKYVVHFSGNLHPGSLFTFYMFFELIYKTET
jgi:hypothetical protein